MKISGFSIARNASKLYYPLRQAIESILPICDEFVVAVVREMPMTRRGGSGTDRFDKIRIIDTVQDLEKYPRGMENAHQTDIAMKACTGDGSLCSGR